MVDSDPITIDSGQSATVRVPDPALAAREVGSLRTGDHFIVRALSGGCQLRLNDVAVDEYRVSNGERLQVGHSLIIFSDAVKLDEGETKRFVDKLLDAMTMPALVRAAIELRAEAKKKMPSITVTLIALARTVVGGLVAFYLSR